SAGQAGNVALTATVWGSSSAALPAVGRLALPAVGRLARAPGSRPANSRAARSHLLASSVPYSVNGENSAHPSGPSSRDRESTRLNSSHVSISYAVFCVNRKTNDCADAEESHQT